jgi:hypothetical protein
VLPILLVIVIAVCAGFVARGSLRPFERLRLHWWGVAIAGLALQVVPTAWRAERSSGPVALVASYALLIAFVWVNRRLPATRLMLLGLALNLTVIALNAGMPVSVAAVRSAGGSAAEIPVRAAGAKHHLMTSDDLLRPLGDVIGVPQPAGIVLSVGDVLLYGGVGWFVVAVMRGRSVENSRPPSRYWIRYRGKHLPMRKRLPRQARARYQAPARPPARAQSGTAP